MNSGSTALSNFGRNRTIRPQVLLQPASEAEVLAALHQYAGRRIRAIGRLHSWSEAATADDVLLDLRNLNSVAVEDCNGQPFATIGAGCQIQRALSELERLGNLTLPSVGLVDQQALAGAMATGTHGSGRNSLSHYAAEIRVACYDNSGRPCIRVINDGEELKAARCSLGSLGIVVSIGLNVRPQYIVEEHFAKHQTLDSVLAAEAGFPLQQFYLLPWRWDFFGQHRRISEKPRTALAWLYHQYFSATFDYGMHLAIIPLVRWLKRPALTRFFLGRVLPLFVIRNWVVRDRSQAMLLMQHDLFRHIEIELFVTRSRLPGFLALTRELLSYLSGIDQAPPAAIRNHPELSDVVATLGQARGSYTHHYPICIRRVLPDDTLISMTADRTEDSYAVSFISYEKPDQRAGFDQFARLITRIGLTLFSARPHWGKVCTLDHDEAAALYQSLNAFRNVASQLDPTGRFRNNWVDRVVFGTKELNKE